MRKTHLVKYILLTSIRSKLYYGIFVLLFIVFGISNFIGSTALSEEIKMQLVYFAGGIRFIIIGGIVIFVCFYIGKSFDNKEIEFILSKNITRNEFVFILWISFCIIGIALLLSAIILLSLYQQSFVGNFLWSLSMVFEILIVITFAITISLAFKNAFNSILSTFSFYFISRMFGFFTYSIDLSKYNDFLSLLLKTLSMFFPRLDLFAKSEWLIYGLNNPQEYYIIVVQSVIYIPLLMFIAFHDFNKKY
ncbi:MAG: hypothetical protein LBT02_02950 [Rickettsiales bacterium]|jgi:hypothetical protein|nr:hypothetical protein [Rickettsiales bacterium]